MYKKYLTILLLIIIALVPIFLPSDESRFDEWSRSLLCPVCQGETLYDSPSEYADDMRIILQEQIANGLNDDEIYEFWVTRYGEKIITNPIERNNELVLIPLFLILVFVLMFVRNLYVKK